MKEDPTFHRHIWRRICIALRPHRLNSQSESSFLIFINNKVRQRK